MWLRFSKGTLRVTKPAIGRLLVGNAGAGYDFGEWRVIVPGDYELVGYGSMPVELHGREGEGMTVGSQIFVIELDGSRVVVAASAGELLKPETSP